MRSQRVGAARGRRDRKSELIIERERELKRTTRERERESVGRNLSCGDNLDYNNSVSNNSISNSSSNNNTTANHHRSHDVISDVR